jgi:hypothetical protein
MTTRRPSSRESEVSRCRALKSTQDGGTLKRAPTLGEFLKALPQGIDLFALEGHFQILSKFTQHIK